MVELHRLNFESRGITVATHWQDDKERVLADRDKLLQAMQNLLDNCCKYTPEGGRVEIGVSRVAAGVKVDFHNSGPGIAPADLPFIFERFFRADRSRSRDRGGAGIGLAITKELVEAHGGSVGAESGPGSTHIWFILPV
jgi:signal transduction histidine kinase